MNMVLGGEAVSLAVNYANTPQFHSAGYTDIQVNSSYVGGQVRQYGNFSFSRVYEAGHLVPSYQPETAYELFRRTLSNLDLATGRTDVSRMRNYSTHGLSSTWNIKNEVPPQPAPTCYLLSPIGQSGTCSEQQLLDVASGNALVHDWIVYPLNSTGNSTSVPPGGSSGSNSTGAGAPTTNTSGMPTFTSPMSQPSSAAVLSIPRNYWLESLFFSFFGAATLFF